MPTFTVSLLADFDRDGAYETDLTARIGSAAGGRIRLAWGMQDGGKYRIGQLQATLNNDDGAFTPEYTSGTYYGQLDDPGIPVKLQATHDSLTYSLFAGYAIDWTVQVGQPGMNTCQLSAEDKGYYLQSRGQVNVAVATDRDVSEAIAAVLAQAGFSASDYDLDTSTQALPYHFETNSDAMQAFGALVASELGGHGYINANGAIRFENRNSRLGSSQYVREVMRDNPIGYWRLSESGGAVAYDHSGNAHHGSYENTPTLGAGSLLPIGDGHSADFEAGSGEYVEVPNHASFANDFMTVEGIFRAESLAAAPAIINWRQTDNVGGFSLEWATTTLIMYVYAAGGTSGAGYYGASRLSIPTDRDIYFVGRYDGEAVTLWLVTLDDGAVFTATNTDPSGAMNNPATPEFQIAGRVFTPGDTFDGRLQEIAYYGEALSDERVRAHIAAALCGFWGDSATVTPTAPPTYVRSARELVSKVSATGRAFATGQDIEVWRDPRARSPFDPSAVSTLSLAAGEVLVEDLVIAGAIVSIVTPAATLDYLGNTASDGSGTDRTSSLAVTASIIGGGTVRRRIENTHASDTVYVTHARLRGVPVTMLEGVTQTVVDEEVAPGQPAKAEFSASIPWVGDTGGKLRDFAVQAYETYSWPYPRLTLRFAWEDDDTVRDMLWLDTGYLVRFHDRDSGQWGTYVKDNWYVCELQHEIEPPTGQCFTTVTLIPSWLYRKLDAIAWDDFDREDASGDLGTSRSEDAWTGDTGWDIVSAEAVPNTDDVTLPYIDLGQPHHDHVVQFDFADVDIASGAEFGVQFRRFDADNYWLFYLDTTDEEAKLVKVVATVATEVAAVAWTPAATAKGRVIVMGDRIRAWLDRKLIIDEDDSALNYGTGVGLYTDDANDELVCRRWYAQPL